MSLGLPTSLSEVGVGSDQFELIGTTTRQKVRDVCGRLFEVEMVISVSQSDQTQMFSAILRTVK